MMLVKDKGSVMQAVRVYPGKMYEIWKMLEGRIISFNQTDRSSLEIIYRSDKLDGDSRMNAWQLAETDDILIKTEDDIVFTCKPWVFNALYDKVRVADSDDNENNKELTE